MKTIFALITVATLAACGDVPSHSDRLFAEQRERIASARALSHQAMVERFGPDPSKWPKSTCTSHDVSITAGVPLSAGGGVVHNSGTVLIC